MQLFQKYTGMILSKILLYFVLCSVSISLLLVFIFEIVLSISAFNALPTIDSNDSINKNLMETFIYAGHHILSIILWFIPIIAILSFVYELFNLLTISTKNMGLVKHLLSLVRHIALGVYPIILYYVSYTYIKFYIEVYRYTGNDSSFNIAFPTICFKTCFYFSLIFLAVFIIFCILYKWLRRMFVPVKGGDMVKKDVDTEQ